MHENARARTCACSWKSNDITKSFCPFEGGGGSARARGCYYHESDGIRSRTSTQSDNGAINLRWRVRCLSYGRYLPAGNHTLKLFAWRNKSAQTLHCFNRSPIIRTDYTDVRAMPRTIVHFRAPFSVRRDSTLRLPPPLPVRPPARPVCAGEQWCHFIANCAIILPSNSSIGL